MGLTVVPGPADILTAKYRQSAVYVPPWRRLADPGYGWNSSWYSDGGLMFVHSDGTIWLLNPYNAPSEVVRYHPSTDTWDRLADAPWPGVTNSDTFTLSHWFAAGEHAGTIFLVGAGRAPLGFWAYAAYEYTPSTGALFQVDTVGASITDANSTTTIGYGLPYPALNAEHGFQLWGSIIQHGTYDPAVAHQTSDYGTWLVGFDMAANTFLPARPGIRIAHEQFANASFASDGTYLYIPGGFFDPWLGGQGADPSEPNDSLDWIRRIDPVFGSSSVVANDPNGHFNWPAAAVFNGSLWLVAGWFETGNTSTKKVRSLDLSTFTWTAQADFPELCEGGLAAVSGGKLYAGLGGNRDTGADGGFYVYEP